MEVLNFFIAILLGALVGLQREYEQQHTHIKKFAGLRTFILISLLGAILGFISSEILESQLLIVVGFVAIIALAVTSYIITYMKYKDISATTEIAAILTFVVGFLCSKGLLGLAAIFGILVAAFLTFKKNLHDFARKIEKKELFAIIKFAIISLVILPLLPNKNYSLLDIPFINSIFINADVLAEINVFNFYHIWLMVILIAGIGLLGYLLVKVLGAKRGYGLTGLVGGLVSSTAVTISMSGESRRHKRFVIPFVIAVTIASATMFVRMLVEVAVVNRDLLPSLIVPLGLMGVVSYGSVIFLLCSKKKKQTKEIEFEQPFALWPAVKFGLFFVLILFVAKLMQLIFGSVGIYATSILSGLADVDAITLTMSSMSSSGQVANNVAVTSIILAACSNLLVKGGMTWFLGGKKFARYVTIMFGIVLAVGLGAIIFL